MILCYNETGDKMKKGILLMVLFLLCGCTSSKNTSEVSSKQLKNYQSQLNTIKKTKVFYDYSKDFQTKLVFSNMGKYYTYDLIVKSPQIKMYDISALAYSTAMKDQYHPSIGIFDTETYNMIPDYVNKSKGYVKGFDLSGRVYKKTSIKMIISYYTSTSKTKKVTHVIEVKNEN